MFNVQLGYDDVERKTTVAVLYNICGPRIREVGARGATDIMEKLFHRLDVVFHQGLSHGFILKVKAQNLIDLPVRYTQGAKVTEQYVLGCAFSIGFAKKWQSLQTPEKKWRVLT